MPQLWVETFVSQYFWLLLSFLTLYIFVYNYLLPNISLAYKARTIQQETKTELKELDNEDLLSKNMVSQNLKYELNKDIDNLNSFWVNTNPENSIDTSIETKLLENSSFEYQDWEISWDNEDDNIEISEEELTSLE